MPLARLERAIFRLSGEGVQAWLDGLITNSISEGGPCFAALLTPQGKIIADFFITPDTLITPEAAGEESAVFWLDTPAKFGADLMKRLRLYRLRAPIEIEDMSAQYSCYALWASDEHGGIGEEGQADPRLPALGRRLITQSELSSAGDYNAHRLSLGIPDSQWDFESAAVFPADANMDLINGVDFKKGCFVGQEVVSRMKRMTRVKKRFRAIVFEGTAQAGDNILSGERVIGTVLSSHKNMGMAMIRLERLASATAAPALNGSPVQVMSGPDGES